MDTETLDGLAYHEGLDDELDELDPPEDHPPLGRRRPALAWPLEGRADVFGIARARVHGYLKLGPAIPMTLALPTVDALRASIRVYRVEIKSS